MGSIEYIILPLLECLVLVGIHSYLGIHVIRRKVIFVDLALAQLAALGATVGFLFGIMPETPAAFIFSIVFAAAGAAVFSVTRMRSERIPHEAVIGLVYAVAAAMAILVIDKAPSGAEHLKNVLVGRIEWVRWHEVGLAAGVYLLVGAVHWIFRKRFFLISEDPDKAFSSGMNVRAWDFLFYLTFGVVISISVKVAGVLLVFVFLVVPAIAAVLITDNRRNQLLIGWGMGTVVSVVGMLLSYHAELPSGPAVVAVYAIALMITAIVVLLVRTRTKKKTAIHVLIGTLVAIGFIGLIVVMGYGLHNSPLGHTQHHHPGEVASPNGAPHHHDNGHHDADLTHPHVDHQVDPDLDLEDPEVLIDWSSAHLDGPDRLRALQLLVDLLADEDSGMLYRSQALEIIEKQAGRAFGYDSEVDPSDNEEPLAEMKDWIDDGALSAQ